MKRKIISVLLTACLSISLLAGCGGNASKTDDSQVKEESSDTATQTTDTAQNEDPEGHLRWCYLQGYLNGLCLADRLPLYI